MGFSLLSGQLRGGLHLTIYIYIKHSEMTKIILKAKILKLAPRAFHYFIMVFLLLSGQLRDNLLFD
jgi:hypothetical protein